MVGGGRADFGHEGRMENIGAGDRIHAARGRAGDAQRETQRDRDGARKGDRERETERDRRTERFRVREAGPSGSPVWGLFGRRVMWTRGTTPVPALPIVGGVSVSARWE